MTLKESSNTHDFSTFILAILELGSEQAANSKMRKREVVFFHYSFFKYLNKNEL